MIKANELRIGNWLLHDGKAKKVGSIHDDETIRFYLDDIRTEGCFGLGAHISPIPLTEEILLKVFDYVDTSGCMKDIFYFKRSFGGNGLIFHYDATNSPKSRQVTIVSLHQLQNLYFALTETELEVNDL